MNQLFIRSLAVPLAYFGAGVAAVLFYENVKPSSTNPEIKQKQENTTVNNTPTNTQNSNNSSK